jgi:enoyl-CoA hydratase
MTGLASSSHAGGGAATPGALHVYETLRYETPAPGVSRIVLNRPERRNAQNLQMTFELKHAFDRVVLDPDVRVAILAGDGPHFCAGHDLQGDGGKAPRDFPLVSTWADFEAPAAEGWFAREKEVYLDITERWRNLSKPTIAEVHGRCAAGGLMLAWACDFIVASDDATFVDAVVDLGMPGVEFFAHGYELGVRKAKAFLMLGEPIDAYEALAAGMLHQVTTRAELSSTTLQIARRLASKPPFALKLLKEAINSTQDAAGRIAGMKTAFALHQLAHAHNRELFGLPIDPRGLPEPLRSRVTARAVGSASPERADALRRALGLDESPTVA